MGRFDSMIAKGVNTYDADATAADIVSGKTAYVAGEKLTGTLVPGGGGGGDISILGFDVDVEAATTIAVGDKLVMEKNTQYVTPTMVSTNIPVTILSMSDDGSVGIGVPGETSSRQVVGEGTTFNVYFRNESGNFDSENMYSFTLANYPNPNVLLYTDPFINEDGTMAVASWTNYNSTNQNYDHVTLIIDIDKENKTASYHYEDLIINHFDYGNANYYYNLRGFQIRSNLNTTNQTYSEGIIFRGNYFIAKVGVLRARKTDDIIDNHYLFNFIFKYENSSFTAYKQLPSGYIFQSNVADFGDNIVFEEAAGSTRSLIKYNFTTNNLDTISPAAAVYGEIRFSKNNGYYCSTNGNDNRIYVAKINSFDFTSTLIGKNNDNVSSYIGCPSSDGQYLYVYYKTGGSPRIYKYENGGYTRLYSISGSGTLRTVHFELPTTYHNANVFSVVPGTEAEYLASATTSVDCSTADRIYGVASNALAVGTRGTARGLFSTMTT